MSSKIHMPHSVVRNAFAVAEKMEPLKSKKDPTIAALCGFLTGGVGLGLYLQSWADFLIPWGMLVFLMVIGLPLAELPAYFVPFFWAIYGYRRVKASNAKLEGGGRRAIVEAEIITEIASPHPAKLQRLDDLRRQGILSLPEHAEMRAKLLKKP